MYKLFRNTAFILLTILASTHSYAESDSTISCTQGDEIDSARIALLRNRVETAERDIGSMRSRNFIILDDEIIPTIKCLVNAAARQLEKIPTSGTKGKEQFAKWDEYTGGPVFILTKRWAALPMRRSYGLMSATELFANDGGQESSSWKTLADYRGAETANLAESLRQLIDKRVPAAQIPTIKAVPSASTNKNRSKPKSEPITVIATPSTLGLAIASAELGRGIGEFIGYLAAERNQYVQLEGRITRDREAYWRCIQTSCGDQATKQLAFVEALMLKDVFILRRPTATVFDGGVVHGCRAEYGAMYNSAKNLIQINPDSNPDVWNQEAHNLFTSNVYANWQACRDRAEYIIRPRAALLQ